MMKDDTKERVVSYYEATHRWYRLFWYTPADLALHYGFWDETTRTRSDALRNENRFLAEVAQIRRTDYILDAGCGVGGSAIWLAEHYGCRVMGISINPSHIAAAKENAAENSVDHLTAFEIRDYTATGIPDGVFDVVWAIESFCHAAKPERLWREVWRILKPGGRLIVADGFQRHPARNKKEQRIFTAFLKGLAVPPPLFLWKDLKGTLEKIGFQNIRQRDMTHAIARSSRGIFWLCLMWTPLVPVTLMLYPLRPHFVRIMFNNWRAGIAQWKALRLGLWNYGVYCAEKVR